MKILKTKNYIFGVTVNAENSLTITAEYAHIGFGVWQTRNSRPWSDAVCLIGSYGGPENLLAKCIEVEDVAAYAAALNASNKERAARQAAADMEKANERIEAHRAAYNQAFGDGTKATPSTLENIAILLKYLNDQNLEPFQLPAMTIGYSCHQYECGRKIATTIKLDKPVEGYTKLEYGAPHNYLIHYTRIDDAILNRSND